MKIQISVENKLFSKKLQLVLFIRRRDDICSKIFPIIAQCYFFHFRIFENKGVKKSFSEEKQKKKQTLEDFTMDIFVTICLPPIRTPVNVFQTWKLSALEGRFAVYFRCQS